MKLPHPTLRYFADDTPGSRGGLAYSGVGIAIAEQEGHCGISVSLAIAALSAVARGQAATRAGMALFDLLARANQRAEELAKAYDRARIAGLACETSYTALAN